MAAPRLTRRALLVAGGAAVLVGAGAVPWPTSAVGDEPPEVLRERILAATGNAYVGDVVCTGRLGLPALPQLGTSVALLTGTTRIRAFVAGPDRYRVDELSPVGERSVYHLGELEYGWDFGVDQLTEIVGATPLRLPRGSDLTPPDLARRLLLRAPTDPVTTLPARRVAGRTATGLRLTPADPATTVGFIDVWADATSALPLLVQVHARGTDDPVLSTVFRAVEERAPDESDLEPQLPPGAGFVRTGAGEIAGALRVLDAPAAPAQLAGRNQVAQTATPGAELPGVGVYGEGLSGFVLIPASREIADQAVAGAALAGGTPIAVGRGTAVGLATPLVSLAVIARGRRGALLTGTVGVDVLEQALLELPSRRRP